MLTANPQHQEPTPWPPTVVPVDLKAVYRELGCLSPDTKPTTGRYRRLISLREVGPRRIEAPPALPAGWIDGIQTSCLIGRTDHRDHLCIHLAAGVAGDDGLTNVNERLAVLCSAIDAPKIAALRTAVPVVPLPSTQPWELALDMADWIDQARRRMEMLTITGAPATQGKVLVVDGPLPPDLERSDVVGVVKSATETDFLPDPDMLPNDGGWRSPAFGLPATTVHERERLSCYVRLRQATAQHPWSYSLIRVEVFADTPVPMDALDRAAALTVATRGYPGGADPRWETQPAPLFRAENMLKARIPHAFKVLS